MSAVGLQGRCAGAGRPGDAGLEATAQLGLVGRNALYGSIRANAEAVLTALQQLEWLERLGIQVLPDHHDRRSDGVYGEHLAVALHLAASRESVDAELVPQWGRCIHTEALHAAGASMSDTSSCPRDRSPRSDTPATMVAGQSLTSGASMSRFTSLRGTPPTFVRPRSGSVTSRSGDRERLGRDPAAGWMTRQSSLTGDVAGRPLRQGSKGSSTHGERRAAMTPQLSLTNGNGQQSLANGQRVLVPRVELIFSESSEMPEVEEPVDRELPADVDTKASLELDGTGTVMTNHQSSLFVGERSTRLVRRDHARGTRNMEASAALRLDNRWRDMFVTHELEVIAEAASKDLVTQQLQLESTRLKKGAGNKILATVHGIRDRSKTRRWSCRLPGCRLSEWREWRAPLSPNATVRLFWDMLGMMFIVYDLVTIPLDMGWDLSVLYGDQRQRTMALTVIMFWLCDFVASFNTGYFRGGTLEMRWSRIAFNYMHTWLLPDVTILAWDVVLYTVPVATGLKMLKSFRWIRVVRVFRVLKMSKITENIEDILTTFGVQWLSLVISLVKNLATIILVAHTYACSWYYLGKTQQEAGGACWLDVFDEQYGVDSSRNTTRTGMLAQEYTKAMYWCLGHLFTGPVDPTMSPQNMWERIFTLNLVVNSLFVVGTGVSSLTYAISEMSKINAESINTRRQLQRYLMAAKVPRELFTRVIRFALYSHKRRAARSLDAQVLELLSETLRSELTMNQRRFCVLHPFFAMLADLHAEVFGHICNAFKSHVYADGDIVFTAGVVARHFYLTHDGTYQMITERAETAGGTRKGEQVCRICPAPKWFCEISLFARFVHTCTLQACTFADAFTLSCNDLIECVSLSPGCIATAYLYAQEYVAQVTESPSTYDELGLLQAHDDMPPTVAAKACESVTAKRVSLDRVVNLESPQIDMEEFDEFMALVARAQDLDPAETRSFLKLLPRAFSELDETAGIYVKMQHADERNRVIAAMVSSTWLLHDRYDQFTCCQAEDKRLSREQWDELQEVIRWANMTPELEHALLVFLAIRGLGKVKSFAKALPRGQSSPEHVVLHLMAKVPHVVPSVLSLQAHMLDLVQAVLTVWSEFNLAQMLQGENTPYHIYLLQQRVEEEGEQLLKFYVVAMIGMMCGLRGVESVAGSKFMDYKTGSNVLRAIKCLRGVVAQDPGVVYWDFIVESAKILGLPTEDPEDCAVARLACLCRVTDSDCSHLQTSWMRLTRGDRRVLTHHFLADGIREDAFVFTFLPLFLANSKSNAAVGLHRALLVLIDLLEVLRAEDYASVGTSRVLEVDLQDLAAFAKEVSSSRVWLATVAHSKVVSFGAEVQILVSVKHKLRAKQTSWEEDPMEVSTMIRRLERRLQTLDTVGEEGRPPPTWV